VEFSDFFAAMLAVALGSVVQTLTGVGGGFLVVPVLAFIDMSLLPAPMVMASMSLSSIMMWRERHHIDTRNVPTILIGIVPGSVAGALVLAKISFEHLGLVFGCVVLLAVALTASSLHVPLNRKSGFIAGVTAGAMGSTTGIGAPVLAVLYQHASGPQIRGTLAVLYTAASALILMVLWFFGRFGLEEAKLGLWLMPGFFLGYFASQHLTARLDKGSIRWAVLVVSAAAALVLIVRSI